MKDPNITEDSVGEIIYAYQGKQIKNRGVSETRESHKRKSRWYKSRFTKFLPSDKSAKIIDVPCGEGNILFFLNDSGYTNSFGWDLDESRVSIAQQLNLSATFRMPLKHWKRKGVVV